MALPNTYDRLDYIQSSGSQYINTGLNTSTKRKIEIGLSATSTSRYNIYGSGGGSQSNEITYSIRVGSSSFPKFAFYSRSVSPGSVITDVVADTNKHDIVLDIKNALGTIDGVDYTLYQNAGTTSYREYVFAYSRLGTVDNSYSFVGRVYYAKYYEDDVLVRNFIPAKRKSDNVVGLYDDVNDVFYTNAGSGSFTYGSILYEVNATENPTDSGTITGTGLYPSGSNMSLLATANGGYLFDYWKLQDYTRLEYIESTGTQYIDTDILANQMASLDYEIDFQMTSTSQSNYASMGCGNWGSSGWYGNIVGFGNSHNGIVCSLGTSGDTRLANKDTNRHKLIIDTSNSVAIFDDVSTPISVQSTTATGHLLLFASATLNGSTPFSTSYCKCRIYSFKAGTIGNFIPVKQNSTNEVGLLNLVDLSFHTNKGTGTFNTGQELGDVEWTSTDNPLSLTVNSDISLIANFKLNYQITLTYDNTLGNATYDWVSGTQIQLVATPNSNAQFKGYYINSIPISTNATYTYTVLSDVVIEARFERVWDITTNVSGNGSIQYTRGTDRNDVVFSVIADTNNHFVKYVVDGVEYTTTPLTLYLTQDTTITAFFEENERYHITVNSNFPYGSFYISDNDVFAGTIITVWARPFPDYNFVKWQDGVLENPRQIEVNSDITLVAEYQRSFETNGIYQYRCYVKDQLDLTSPPKAFMVVDTFDISTDLLTNATSSITVMKMLSDIDEGDVLVLYDPMGTTLYTGVINSIEDRTINCSQMQSFYKGTWIYNVSPQDFLEHEIAVLLQDYADGKLYRSSYVDPLVAQRLGGITIDYVGTTTVNLPTDLDDDGNEQMTTYDMEEFIYELYQKYSIKFEFEINISGTNYVHIKVPSYEAIKVGNNMFAIQDMSPITEIEETNKLVIYAQDKTYRTTYIATKNSIVEAPSTTANRFNITNTEVVFSDDPVEDLVASNLPSQMFNHKLTFTLIIRNFLYQFGDFNLGGELDIYHNDDYYRSVLTGYEISKQSNQNITEVSFVCGTVRIALTKMLTLGKV